MEWSEAQKLSNDDPASGDEFGCSVFVYGEVIAVGSRYDDDKGTDSGEGDVCMISYIVHIYHTLCLCS